ncbi:MAG TPA: LytTR family DNA-binding domain-containing protein [Bacillales bacterium]|nr:LytTR family DNA-binding domain-containing protein [Bacillales bacterium]
MKIKALIAEDERLVREEMAYLLQQEDDFILCPSAENGRQMLDLFEQYEPDVVFMDIHMPSLSGIEAARKLKSEAKDSPLFVFITAYEEHAVEAFDLEAVDYLLKPYDEERFQETLGRIRKHLWQPVAEKYEGMQASKLLVEDKDKLVVLDPELILYAERVERLIEIHTVKEVVRSKMTLQELEDRLSGFAFFRPHRSYLVNLDQIEKILPWFNGAYNLVLADGKETKIPVSRTSAKSLFRLLQLPAHSE